MNCPLALLREDFRALAHANLLHAVPRVAALKNVPVDGDQCRSIVDGVLFSFYDDDCRRFATANDPELITRAVWQMNNYLDWLGAANLAAACAKTIGRETRDVPDFRTLIDAMINALKGDNPITNRTIRWPRQCELEQIVAIRAAPAAAPTTANLGALLTDIMGRA